MSEQARYKFPDGVRVCDVCETPHEYIDDMGPNNACRLCGYPWPGVTLNRSGSGGTRTMWRNGYQARVDGEPDKFADGLPYGINRHWRSGYLWAKHQMTRRTVEEGAGL